MSTHDNSIKIQENQSRDLLQYLIWSSPLVNKQKIQALLHLHEELFAHLRTKIIPENHVNEFTENLFYTTVSSNKKIDIYCLLASPTALKEIQHFLEFVRIFQSESMIVSPHFILVEWINFHNDIEEEHRQFRKIMDELIHHLCDFLTEYHMMTFSLHQSDKLRPFMDDFFMKELEYVMSVLQTEKVRYAEKTNLDIDAEWIKNFYSRQESLCNLNPKQAMFDLAVRRTIGSYISNVMAHSKEANLLVTSELNKRFLKCYRTDATICNINIPD